MKPPKTDIFWWRGGSAVKLLQEGEFWWRERWPATIATLIAIGLFVLSSGTSLVIGGILVFALLGFYFGGRLDRGSVASWAVRIGLYALIYALTIHAQTNLADNVILAPGLNLFAQIAMAEFALRHWFRGDVPLWADIIPSSVILFAACSTMEPLYVTFLAPLWFLFIVLAMAQTGHRADAPLSWRWINLGTRIGSLILAIAIGAFAHYCFRQYRSEILDFGSMVLGEHAQVSRTGNVNGIEKDPTLGATFDADSPPTRMLLVHGDLRDPYLRGMSYDMYARGSWLPTDGQRSFTDISPSALQMTSQPSSYVVNIERLVSDDGMVSFPLTASSVSIAGQDPLSWARADGGPVKAEDIDTLRYRVTVPGSDTAQGIACDPPTAQQRARLLYVPPAISPRVVKLALTLRGTDQAATIQAVTHYLMANNTYSRSTNPGSGDPVSNFILRHNSAHCQYFASAAVILLRAAGVPSRYVIGYYAHEPYGDGMVVRAEDAHAWAESYVDGTGWVTVDATPASGRPDRTARHAFWWQWSDKLDDALRHARDRWAALSRSQQAVAIFALVGMASLYFLIRARKPAPAAVTAAAEYTPPEATLADLRRRCDWLLDARGIACPPAVPWREHLDALRRADLPPGFDADMAVRFVTLYSAARFGGDTDPAALIEMSQLLTTLESETK